MEETWLHIQQPNVDLRRFEEKMEPEPRGKDLRDRSLHRVRLLRRRLGTARMREDFVGAVGLNKIARCRLDPRDQRSDADFYELIGDDAGVFGCMSLLACHDVCPKNLPLATEIAFLRRKMVAVGWK